ncbi:MAG: hypothetical protein ACPL4N_01200, partial [Candidatus Norongarragalinales archaeon]
KLEEKVGGLSGGAPSAAGAAAAGEVASLKEELKALEDKVAACATREELMEVRYVVDTINPLEYATLDQVKEVVEEKIASLKSGSAKQA